MSTRRIFAVVGLLFALSPVSAGAAPVSIHGPLTAPLNGDGTGLCAATAISTMPGADFGNLTAATYTGAVNTFLEAHKADRVEAVIRTLLDLSNNNEDGLKQSRGDFTDAMAPECKS